MRLVIAINNRIMERLVAKMLTVAKLLSDVNKPVLGAFMSSFSEGGFNVSLLFSSLLSSLLSSLFDSISFRIDIFETLYSIGILSCIVKSGFLCVL